jgi:FkbM family methyltransferase
VTEIKGLSEFEFKGKKFNVDSNVIGDFIGGEGPIMAKYLEAKESDVFFDVGASWAMWTLYGLSLGARVYSFEPVHSHFERLVAYVKANPALADRCALLECGLASTETMMTMAEWSKAHGWLGEEVDKAQGNPLPTPDYYVPLKFRTIDSFLPELDRLDWIKIDVEGGEYEVLLGGLECLTKYKPKMIIENHLTVNQIGEWMRKNNIHERMIRLLRTLKYTITEVPHQGRGFIICN